MKIYSVELPKNSLDFVNKLNIKDLVIKDDKISFKTDKNSLNILKNKYEYVYFANNLKSLFKNVISNHIVTLFGMFSFIFVIVFISKTITEIKFTNSNTYNEDVYESVVDNLKKVGPFRFLNKDLNSIDSELKKEFSYYEWIGISKKGTVLIIEIAPSFIDEKINEENLPGSLYAKKDAIIKKYHIEKGIVMVQEEQYVKKGDLLISGDIVHYDNTIEAIHPKGYVIGETLEYYDYKVPKTQTNNIRNGKVEYKDYYFFKDKMLGKDKFTEEYDEVVKMNFFNLLFIKRRYYYYREDVKTLYSLEEAESFAKSLIYKEFIKNKTNEQEKIIYIKLARFSEDNDNYYFRFVVKSEERIEEFLTN